MTGREQVIVGLATLADGLRALLEEEARKPILVAADIIDVQEFAKLTGNTPRAVQRWIGLGLVRAERHGRFFRIERSEVEKFRARCRARVSSPKAA